MYVYIFKSSVSPFNRTANKDLISQFGARLCQIFSRSQLAERGPNSQSYHEEGDVSSENNVAEPSWQNSEDILAVNNKLSNT
jgi:hypothetical protein